VPRPTVHTQPTQAAALSRTGRCSGGAARPTRLWGCRPAAVLVFALWSRFCGAGDAWAARTYDSDEWITECGTAPGDGAASCSITVPFWQSGYEGKGSFALVVMLQSGNIGIVGKPFPLRAVLRVDKNPPVECRQTRYCIFSTGQALAVVKELEVGTLILIDVVTAKSQFSFSLTPKGYQAGIAQIRAWGYRLPTD
jgi:hypothetical protein